MLMISLLLSAALATGAAEFEARTIDGQSAVGRIAQLNAQQLVLETGAGPTTFALNTLAGLTRKPAAATADRKLAIHVELIDQSLLAISGYTVRGGVAQLELSGGAKLEVPTRAIRWVRFAAAACCCCSNCLINLSSDAITPSSTSRTLGPARPRSRRRRISSIRRAM